MEKPGKKVFYGWFILFALWLMTAVSLGLINNCMSQFLKPMCEAFDMPRTSFSLLVSIMAITTVVIYPVVGGVLNKHRSAWIVRGCGLLVVAGYTGLSFVTGRTGMYLMGILIGIGAAFTNSCMVNIVLNNWFHAKKGFAMGFVSTGSGFGSAIFNPLASSLIASGGYQFAFRVLGVIALVLMLPTFLLYKFDPEDKGVQPYGIEPGTEQAENGKKITARPASMGGMTRKEAVKDPKFYLLLFICFGMPMGVMGVWGHISAYLTDIGYEPAAAAKLISLISIVLAISKFIFGWLNDRMGTYRNYLLYTAISVVGMFMTLQFSNKSMAIVCALLFGVTLSETTVMSQLITVHTVGSKHFKDIYGIVSMARSLGAMAAGPFSAVIFDATGSYSMAIAFYGCLYLSMLIIGAVIFRKGYGEQTQNN